MKIETVKNITIIVLSAVLGFIVVFALDRGNNVAFKVSKNGTLEFNAEQGQSLTQLLDKGFEAVEHEEGDTEEDLARKKSEMRALKRTLGSHGYHTVSDPALAERIRTLPKDDPQSVRLRNILYDLEGPFALPGTLRGADANMLDAIADLYKGLTDEPADDSRLYASLYTDFIRQETVFSPFKHEIVATGQLLHEAEENTVPMVFTCPDSILKDGTIVLVRSKGKTWNVIRQFTVQQNPVLHTCSARTPFEFLTGSKVKLGMNQAAFDELFPDDASQSERLLGSGTMSLIAYPRHTLPIIPGSATQ